MGDNAEISKFLEFHIRILSVCQTLALKFQKLSVSTHKT